MAALKMCAGGVDKVKIARLPSDMGVTTGSFYWHFETRAELLHALLEFWELEITDDAIAKARTFSGSPTERIQFVMHTIMENGLARYDLAIWHWAQSDASAQRVFRRVFEKRCTFAASMFSDASFSKKQAEARGRMMVLYLMGETTLVRSYPGSHENELRDKQAILLARP